MKKIAINFGGGYVPGLNSVVAGAVLSANELGWEVVGILDGFDGLLFPDRYPEGGLIKFNPKTIGGISGSVSSILGTAVRSDPFNVRTINEDGFAEEVDMSELLLTRIKEEKIDAVISVVGSRALSILWKLNRKGLQTVCIPKSVENDVAATSLSFGFNSALSFVAEMLERARIAAETNHKIGVVEVMGENSGWLALQSGMAVCADAVLIPEIPFDLRKIVAKLKEKANSGKISGLIVVAEGARPAEGTNPLIKTTENAIKSSLSPGATGNSGSNIIERSGRMANEVAMEIQRLTGHETSALVLSQLARGGSPTVVDRQLGLGYGAGAVRALNSGQSGVMVVFQPPDLKFVPMTEALNKVRTVPVNSEFVQIARNLGISLGD
ncbi:MAG TPA: 6-phosphofructokinase [Prolixibacteraceae bacterium]|nr:6-phosphofructokinase [Prolixibacteraceae bacterium]